LPGRSKGFPVVDPGLTSTSITLAGVFSRTWVATNRAAFDGAVAVYKEFACPHCATYAAEVEPQVIGEYVDTVESDRSTGIDRGVEGTPTVFVDGETLDGWSREAVDAAIADARSE
jgi:protein-disulfide isomerase